MFAVKLKDITLRPACHPLVEGKGARRGLCPHDPTGSPSHPFGFTAPKKATAKCALAHLCYEKTIIMKNLIY